MKITEKENGEKRCMESWPNMSCCGKRDTGEMSDCCKSMKGCRWFPLLPIIFGVAFLFSGYCLDAEITRILWIIGAGLIVLVGLFGLFMMGRMKKMCCG